MEESDTSSEEEEDDVDGAPQSLLTAAMATEECNIKQASEPLTGKWDISIKCKCHWYFAAAHVTYFTSFNWKCYIKAVERLVGNKMHEL